MYQLHVIPLLQRRKTRFTLLARFDLIEEKKFFASAILAEDQEFPGWMTLFFDMSKMTIKIEGRQLGPMISAMLACHKIETSAVEDVIFQT